MPTFTLSKQRKEARLIIQSGIDIYYGRNISKIQYNVHTRLHYKETDSKLSIRGNQCCAFWVVIDQIIIIFVLYATPDLFFSTSLVCQKETQFKPPSPPTPPPRSILNLKSASLYHCSVSSLLIDLTFRIILFFCNVKNVPMLKSKQTNDQTSKLTKTRSNDTDSFRTSVFSSYDIFNVIFYNLSCLQGKDL